MPSGEKGHTYLTKPAANWSRFDLLSMCDLLLPRGIKRLSACSVFFSQNNFSQKSFLKTNFQRKVKAMVSTKCIFKRFLILPFINFAEL